MRGSFNEPRLMGNCTSCYYYTSSHIVDSFEGLCHRYPKQRRKNEMDYCGEFAWKRDAANVGGDSE